MLLSLVWTSFRSCLVFLFCLVHPSGLRLNDRMAVGENERTTSLAQRIIQKSVDNTMPGRRRAANCEFEGHSQPSWWNKNRRATNSRLVFRRANGRTSLSEANQSIGVLRKPAPIYVHFSITAIGLLCFGCLKFNEFMRAPNKNNNRLEYLFSKNLTPNVYFARLSSYQSPNLILTMKIPLINSRQIKFNKSNHNTFTTTDHQPICKTKANATQIDDTPLQDH